MTSLLMRLKNGLNYNPHHMTPNFFPLLFGWFLDKCLGDPSNLPHPVVWFGRWIAFCEKRTNKGRHRKFKGAVCTLFSIAMVYVLTLMLQHGLLYLCRLWNSAGWYLYYGIMAILIFYGLAGQTLIKEVEMVFAAADRSLEEGRKQVSRIVGRNTEQLSDQEIRTAALETLAENLSDGVIAPLFWLAVLGVPGMMAYKMVNTLDSMIGYQNKRYKDFGYLAAKTDDLANYLPARLTALLMAISSKIPHKGTKTSRSFRKEWRFILQYGCCHASPNSGYPEAALAGILDCRFGGTHYYFQERFYKPYIGHNNRPLHSDDMKCAIAINQYSEIIMLAVCLLLFLFS